MKIFRLHFPIVLLCCLFRAGTLLGQSTKPAAPLSAQAKADQAVEDETLQISADASPKPAAAQATGTAAAASSSVSDLMRVIFALAIVVGIILLLRTGVRRVASLPGNARAGRLVTVVSRSMISPRQQILVLQVGKRLLVVGDSGGSMSVLSEMTDPDEIASLIGQSRQTENAVTDRGTFGTLFRRATEPFDASDVLQEQGEPGEAQDVTEPSVDPVSVEEVGGLLDKVRLLQEQFKLRSEGKSA